MHIMIIHWRESVPHASVMMASAKAQRIISIGTLVNWWTDACSVLLEKHSCLNRLCYILLTNYWKKVNYSRVFSKINGWLTRSLFQPLNDIDFMSWCFVMHITLRANIRVGQVGGWISFVCIMHPTYYNSL